MQLSRRIGAVVVALASVAACGTDRFERDTAQASSDPSFGWEKLGERTEQGSLTVPVDYDNPQAGSFDLYVVRHLAEPDKRIGSLLVNPGGPGFGGSVLAESAGQIYSPDLVERFDIIGWDPRGTGLSTPAIDCIDDYDRFFGEVDITPDDDAERTQISSLAEELATSCDEKNPFLQFVGTNNSARDMDAIRSALGETTISYFGFSYGSELGAVWATLFPDTVRAAVLDGAVDPVADDLAVSIQQSAGFEASLTTFLARCSDDAKCAFHNGGDAEGAFDQLMTQLDEQPIAALDDRPALTRAMAITGVAQAMYSDSFWPELADALKAAQDGDGSGLMTLYDEYFGLIEPGQWGDELEAFQAISCMDNETRLTVDEDDATSEQIRASAPRIAAGTTGSYFCTFFPPSDDPRADIDTDGAPPIVVVGTTGDAATPLEGTRSMADTLSDGRLVIVTADQHTGYGSDECATELVDAYLIDPAGEAPPPETTCT